MALAAVTSWFAAGWAPAFLPTGLFLLSALLMLALGFQPAIVVRETGMAIGNRVVNWRDIRRLDSTGWVSPLVLYLSLDNGKRILVVYPGDLKSANDLLTRIRRSARFALIDGVPHHQFWGETPLSPDRRPAGPTRYPMLRPEDEAEVEQLFQRLKAVGHLDPKNSAEES